MTKNNNPLKFLIFILPLICGTVGFFAVDHQPLLHSLFRSVLMYALGYDDTPPNVWVEIARWTAPLVSAYSVIMLASSLRSRLRNFLHMSNAQAVTVYGPKEDTAPLLAALGQLGVECKSTPTSTARHLLLWDETENLRFYEQYRDRLQDKQVYLRCQSVPAQTALGANLHIFCPEETAARLFWKENGLYETSRRCQHQMQIVLIGWGRLGSELLNYALQYNVFSPQQHIEYHIFHRPGENITYLQVHHELGQLEDKLIFHSEAWTDCLPLLERAERIIVTEQENQTALLSQLLLAVKEQPLDVFAANEASLGILDDQQRLRCFRWHEEAYRPEHIFSEELYRQAQILNLRYAHLYKGAEETDREREAQWQELDTFTRYSNISSADYQSVRLQMLQALDEPTEPDRLAPDTLELLAELEHMRWCRYHWLNNWTHGHPEDGQNRDSQKRIHVDLLPFHELPDSERQKDRETVKLLLELASASVLL